jgi:hypothetical protein
MSFDPRLLFAAQLGWFLLAWSILVRLTVWPWSRRLPPDARLALWVAPQMFRVLGLGLLVPNLSPGMPLDFALATAAGDSLTASLALLAFVGLRRGLRRARALAWACTIVGTLDLLAAFTHAMHSGALPHLAAQWYVPVFAGPLMIVSHVACFAELRGLRRASARS